MENKNNIEKKYKTKEEAQQFLDFLKEKDNLLFEKYVVKTFGNKKETYHSIICKKNELLREALGLGKEYQGKVYLEKYIADFTATEEGLKNTQITLNKVLV